MTITTGTLLGDRYRLTRRMAAGGMGEVWAASDTRLARDVAVKILKAELTTDPEFVGRFRAEARITASLNDPGIAAVHDYGEVASLADGPLDTAYLVMELVAGEPLSAVLARDGRLSAERTLDLLAQSGTALQAAHSRGLVHRDLKPSNILITPTGRIKITDFGIAKAVYQLPVTRSGLVMGTAQYFAPEQAAGHGTLPASDIYALGVVAFECLAGARPFDDTSPVAAAAAQIHRPVPPLPPTVPPPVAALVGVMLAKDPAWRYPDGAALAAACAAVLAGAPVPAGPTAPPALPAAVPAPVTPSAPTAGVQPTPPPPSPVANPRHRRRGPAVALLVIAVIVLAGIVTVALLTTPWVTGS